MIENNAEAWDNYWLRFEKPEFINYTPEILSIAKAYLDLETCQILEIGAGTGGNSSKMGELGACVVTLELSSAALSRIQHTARQARVQLNGVNADAFWLPFASESFDFVFHQGFLEHFSNPVALIQEQRRILRKGGYILVDIPQRYNIYTLYKHYLIKSGRWPYGGWEREFSYKELYTLLKANGFQIMAAYGRGYFPRPFEMLRHLPNAELKLLKRRIIPQSWWKSYHRFWNRFEHSALGINTLQCIGILAEAH